MSASKATELKFRKYHSDNPHVYRELVALARAAKAKGYDEFAIKWLLEGVRWGKFFGLIKADGEFRINNNYAPIYSRLIMSQEPDLAGVFTTRERRGEPDPDVVELDPSPDLGSEIEDDEPEDDEPWTYEPIDDPGTDDRWGE